MMVKRLAAWLSPDRVAHAHCDLPCGVYDPAQARIEAESVAKIIEKYHASDDPVYRERAIFIKARQTAGPCAGPAVLASQVDVSGARQALASIVGEDQRLVLPAETALVVDRQPGVAVRLTAHASDPLHLGRGRIVARPVALDVLGSHESLTVLPIISMGPAYHEEPGNLSGDSRVFPTIYT